MSKLACNVAHFKKGACGAMAKHIWEKRGEKDEHSNQDIHPERSKDNIALVLPEKSLYQTVKEKIAATEGRVTANSVWLSNWIVYPPEELQNPLTTDKEALKQYYNDVMDWMRSCGYIPEMAVVHLDETTVHAHIVTVPITPDNRLSRRDMYTRANLNIIQSELPKHLAAKGWDIQRGESTKDKQVRSKSVPEYKKAAEQQKQQLVNEIEQIKEDNKEILSSAEAAAIKEKSQRSFTGGLKGVKYSEFEQICRTAATVDQALKDKEAAERRAKAAEAAAKNAAVEAQKAAQAEIQRQCDNLNRQLESLRRQDKAELNKALDKADKEYEKYNNWNISFGKTRMEAELRVVNKQNARMEAFINSNPDIAERFKIFQKGSRSKDEWVK